MKSISNQLYGVRLGNIIKIMTELDESANIARNVRKLDFTYSWCLKLFRELERLNLIHFKKSGREYSVKMTCQGKVLKDYLTAICNLVKECERNASHHSE